MTKPNEATTTGRSPAEVPAIPAGQSSEHGTNSHTPQPYKWADATPGNTLALKHGAYSERAIAAKCEQLEPGFESWAEENAPWVAAPAFAPQRLNLLRSQAIAHLLFDDILATTASQGASKVPTRRLETALSALRGEREALALMGLTVRTKAELGHTVASTEATLVDLAAQGRQTSGYIADAQIEATDG